MRCLIVSEIDPAKDKKHRYIKKMREFQSVSTASNIKQAVIMLKKYSYDLVILGLTSEKDANMKLLKWIRASKINLGVIYVSSDNEGDLIREAFGYGVCDFVLRPYTSKRFREAVVRAVGRRTYFMQFKHMTQEEIDHFITLNVIMASELIKSKGISAETLATVKEAIDDEHEGFSAQQISDKTGLSRITVRRYLEQMVGKGLLETELEYGEIGRPQKTYRKVDGQKT